MCAQGVTALRSGNAGMRGMKGYGPPLIPRDIRGRELISTGDLREAFAPLDRSLMFRWLKRAGVIPDAVIRGPGGERYWPRAQSVSVIARKHATRKRRA